jgi:hypothetical protein
MSQMVIYSTAFNIIQEIVITKTNNLIKPLKDLNRMEIIWIIGLIELSQ